MKKLLTFATCAIAASLAVSAQAQTITSIMFNQGGNLAPTDVAGAVPASYWNNVAPGGWYASLNTTASSGLVNSTGAASSVGASITGYGTLGWGDSFASGTPDFTLAQAGDSTAGVSGTVTSAAPNPVTLTLSGLNAGDNYSFVVEIAGGMWELGIGSLSLNGGPNQFFATPNGGWSAVYLSTWTSNPTTTDLTTAFATNPGGAAAYQSNYLEFTGITGSSSATFTLNSLGAFPDGYFVPAGTKDTNGNGGNIIIELAGVQVIDNGPAVPEPSTWAMMLGGLGMLLTGQRIRRSRKS